MAIVLDGPKLQGYINAELYMNLNVVDFAGLGKHIGVIESVIVIFNGTMY